MHSSVDKKSLSCCSCADLRDREKKRAFMSVLCEKHAERSRLGMEFVLRGDRMRRDAENGMVLPRATPV